MDSEGEEDAEEEDAEGEDFDGADDQGEVQRRALMDDLFLRTQQKFAQEADGSNSDFAKMVKWGGAWDAACSLRCSALTNARVLTLLHDRESNLQF